MSFVGKPPAANQISQWDGTKWITINASNLSGSSTITGSLGDPNIKLLMHFQGTSGSSVFTDSSDNPMSFSTAGTVQLTNTQAKFGSTSLSLNGSNSNILSGSNAKIAFGRQPFTVECWIWFNQNNIGYQPILGFASTGDFQGPIIILESNNTLSAYASNAGSSWNYAITTSYVPATNQWIHVAYVGDGNTLKLYANGVLIGTNTSFYELVTARAFYVGYYPHFPGGARTLNGYIDEVRITVGKAQYIQNFSTSSVAFPDAISSTVINTWNDQGNELVSTGSISIDSQNRKASQLGNDVFFYVSGTSGITGSSGKISVFGGDVRTSSSLYVGPRKTHNTINTTAVVQTSGSTVQFAELFNYYIDSYQSVDAEATVTAVNLDGYYRTNINNSFYHSFGTGSLISLGQFKTNERFTPRSAGAGVMSQSNPQWSANLIATGSNIKLIVTGAGVIDWFMKLNATINTTTVTSNYLVVNDMPMGIPNCVCWLRADMGFIEETTTWTDQSGNGNHFVGGVGVGSGSVIVVPVSDIGGQAAAAFGAGYLSNATLLNGASAGEIFIVARGGNDPPSSNFAPGMWYIGSDASLYNHTPFSDGNIYDGTMSTARKTVGNPVANLFMPHIINVWSAANDWSFNIGRTNVFSTVTNTFGISRKRNLGYGSPHPTGPFISAYDVGGVGGASWNGYIAEFIAFSRKLNSSERQNIISYLGKRYKMPEAG